MKGGVLIEKVMHFIVHNSFLITVAIMCLVHATLLCIMWCADVQPLVYFNIVSVIIYIFCIVMCKSENILPIYVSILLEVTVYAVVSINYIGWNCGSICFLCSIVPIIIYFGCFLFKGSQRWFIVITLTAIF